MHECFHSIVHCRFVHGICVRVHMTAVAVQTCTRIEEPVQCGSSCCRALSCESYVPQAPSSYDAVEQAGGASCATDCLQGEETIFVVTTCLSNVKQA
jgi:hypothetical protein